MPAPPRDPALYALAQEAYALVAKLFAAGRQDLADRIQPVATDIWMAADGKEPRQ